MYGIIHPPPRNDFLTDITNGFFRGKNKVQMEQHSHDGRGQSRTEVFT